LARAIGLSVREFRKTWKGTRAQKKEAKEEEISPIREIAKRLGIEVEGKNDEEIVKEIEKVIKKEKQ
jgi:Sec-independent protein translocase protein TatA